MKQPTVKALAGWILDRTDYKSEGATGYAGGLAAGMYAARALSKKDLEFLQDFLFLAHRHPAP